MGNVKLENNVMEVVGMLEEEAIRFLYEAGAELLTQVQRNTKVDTGQLKNSWQLVVDEEKLTATVGSPLENAIWEEFGTGEFALDGKGRQSAWYIPIEKVQGHKKPTFNGKVVVVYGKEGQAFYKTNGKKPTRALTKATETLKPKLPRLIEHIMRGR